jgi:chromosome segregation ATPase
MSSATRIIELEQKLAAERQRNAELQADLEKSRCWARAWKRAAKSELDVIRVLQSRRRHREAAGIDETVSKSTEMSTALEKQLAEARQQIDFLEREQKRWMENAEFSRQRNGELSARLSDLETELQETTNPNGRNGR